MWNGFLRITAMIGVIGVGLFAVYHAQKQMNFKVPFPFESSSEARALTNDSDNSTSEAPAKEPILDDPTQLEEVSQDQEPESTPAAPPARKLARQPAVRREVEEQVELAVEEQAPPVKKSASRTVAAALVTVKEEESEFFESNPVVNKSTRELPPNRRAVNAGIRKVSATQEDTEQASEEQATAVEEEVKQELKKELDVDVTTSESSTEPPLSTPETLEAIESTEPVVAKTQETNEFDLDSTPPPRSKRAMQKLGKNPAMKMLEEAFPKDEDDAPAASTPATNSELSAPVSEPAKKKSTRESIEQQEPLESDPPKTLPVELDSLPSRADTNPAPKNLTEPPSLPIDLGISSDDAPPSRPSRQNRDTGLRRRDTEIRQVDMVGDGIAGDASQRGIQQPRLSIEKKAQQQAVLGQPLIYEIVVRNTGNIDAHNVVIEDRIPKGAELIGTAPQAELSGKRLIWNQPLLRSNEEKSIKIKVMPTQEGSIGSVARVYFATEVTAEIVVSAPQLEFKVNAPREVRIGQKFDMVYVLKNTGKVAASNIVVRDIVPPQLRNDTGNDIECPIGALAPGEAREIVLPVTALKTGNVVNQAILTADSGIEKQLKSDIDIVGEMLVLTRSGQNRVYVERTVAFTNSIRNDGNQAADSINISEAVPAGMQFATASDGGRFDSRTGCVVWTVGPLAPGAEKTVDVRYVPKKTGTFNTKITAMGSLGSTAVVNSALDVVGKPEIQMESLSTTGAVTVGDRITSRFQLSNTGTAAATNVQLVIHLPPQLRLISTKGAKSTQVGDDVIFEPIPQFDARAKATTYELVLEPIAEAEAQIGLEISADHLTKPGRRIESIQIASDPLR